MIMEKIAAALSILRHAEELEKLAKGEGILGGARKIYGAVAEGAQNAGKKLIADGSPIAGAIVTHAPKAAVAAGAYGAYKSDTAQNAINKYRMWQYNRQMKQQQGY